MKKKYLLLLHLTLTILLFALPSCSLLESPNLKLNSLLVSLAENYLRNVILNNENGLDALVAWPSLLNSGTSQEISRKEFRKQLAFISQIKPVQDHPLIGLKLLSVSASGDNGEVVLEKAGDENPTRITISFMWAGSGWVVSNDSIFGKDKLAAQLQRGKKGKK